jgi:hypothetical protein
LPTADPEAPAHAAGPCSGALPSALCIPVVIWLFQSQSKENRDFMQRFDQHWLFQGMQGFFSNLDLRQFVIEVI